MPNEVPRGATQWLSIAVQIIRELSSALNEATYLVDQLDTQNEHDAAVQQYRDLLEKTRQIVDRGNVPEEYPGG